MNQQKQIEYRIIQVLLSLIGLTALVTSCMMFFLGAKSLPGITAISPTVDNELRFYATFWFSYGVLALWIAQKIVRRVEYILIVAGIFLLSGIGRLLSFLLVGAPHIIFSILMILELVGSIVLIALHLRISRVGKA